MQEKTKILIADDMEINRCLLKEIFDENYEVLEAADGNEVIRMIEKSRQNLGIILLDIYMPDMNGFEVLEYMKNKGYLEQIPVVVITVSDSEDTAMHAYDYKVAEIIYKPFSMRIVERRVRNVISLYQNKRRLEEFIMAEMEKERPPYQALLYCNHANTEKLDRIREMCSDKEQIEAKEILDVANKKVGMEIY